MWRRLKIALLCWLIAIAAMTGTASAEPAVEHDFLAKTLAGLSGSRILEDVARLSGPDFNGRQTGTADDLRSGLFVADRFRSLGLAMPQSEALGSILQGWMLREPVTAGRIEAQPSLHVFAGPDSSAARLGADYLPILDSPSVNVTAPIVFVGYGIADPARGFDEYAGLDVRNRIVLFLRGKPERYPVPVTQTDKERVAREKGAVAFLTATGPILSAYEARRGISGTPSALYTQPDGDRPLPGAWISTDVAKQILAAEEHSLLEVQEQLNRAVPRSFSTGVLARLAWESTQEPGTLHNVLGILPGRESGHGAEALVIGAHRDHFGRQAGLLFPGADDNASGTAVLLEVARVLTASGVKPKRTILFISFSGEEQGLLGSRLYVSHPLVPLARTSAMINVDHAGIGNGKLTVGVTGLSKEMAIEAGRHAGLADLIEVFGFFPGGDHVPFKEAGVPTITVVSAGVHPYFHQPTDTVETVKPEILERVARYVAALSWQLANAP
ncbi:MAG: M20/M25/M40 family metallo-hydrolase [Nitrospirae bacterium]|nr:MAG: M20/M25/M40 family metallo-hydrolase [Nitrospirota bacterium]